MSDQSDETVARPTAQYPPADITATEFEKKVQSVGAHKGAMFSTAPYQRGALEFAKTHGIALVTVTEGRFTFEARSASPPPAMSREEAFENLGLPTFVGHSYSKGSDPSWTNVTALGTERPEDVAEQILGVVRLSHR